MLCWRLVQQYLDEKDADMGSFSWGRTEIVAVGTGEAQERWQEGWDCVLVAPQASYRMDDMKKEIQIPMAAVPSLDYAIGNAENVMKLAHELCGK